MVLVLNAFRITSAIDLSQRSKVLLLIGANFLKLHARILMRRTGVLRFAVLALACTLILLQISSISDDRPFDHAAFGETQDQFSQSQQIEHHVRRARQGRGYPQKEVVEIWGL